MTSLAVQWLRLHLPIHVVNWKIPGWGATISHALGPKNQNIKQNIVTNSIKTFKNGQHQKNLKKRGQQEMLIRNEIHGTSLVVPRLRICLGMQRTWVQSLVQEDPICCGVAKPKHH